MKDQITLTRDEWKKKIAERPEGFGIVQAINAKKVETEINSMTHLIETCNLMIIIKEIEEVLFQDDEEEETGTAAAAAADFKED